jgi:hypothetical protein
MSPLPRAERVARCGHSAFETLVREHRTPVNQKRLPLHRHESRVGACERKYNRRNDIADRRDTRFGE